MHFGGQCHQQRYWNIQCKVCFDVQFVKLIMLITGKPTKTCVYIIFHVCMLWLDTLCIFSNVIYIYYNFFLYHNTQEHISKMFMKTGSKTLCGVVCCDNGKSPNK